MSKLFTHFDDFCDEFASVLESRSDLETSLQQHIYGTAHDLFSPWNHDEILTPSGSKFDAEKIKIEDNVSPPIGQHIAGVNLPHNEDLTPVYIFQFDFIGFKPRYVTVVLDKNKFEPAKAWFTDVSI